MVEVEEAKRLGSTTTIFNASGLKSASRFTETQFLHLRVLSQLNAPEALDLSYFSLGLASWETPARRMLEYDVPLQRFLDNSQGQHRDGIFSLVELFQEVCVANIDEPNIGGDMAEVQPQSSSRSRPPPLADEGFVNFALVSLLNAVTHRLCPHSFWAPLRTEFKAVFGREGQNYKARPDGCLLYRSSERLGAIFEEKRGLRNNQIRIQEAAEMVAWIRHEDIEGVETQPRCRMLISQDRHEIFVTFAEYSDGYLRYLREGVPEPGDADAFLTMHEYGPWPIQSKADMRDLVQLLLQFAMWFEAGWVPWNAGLLDRLPVLPALRAFTSRILWGQLVLLLCCLLAGYYLGSSGILRQ